MDEDNTPCHLEMIQMQLLAEAAGLPTDHFASLVVPGYVPGIVSVWR
jgi:hypothetical protein